VSVITDRSLVRSSAMLEAIRELQQALSCAGGVLVCGEPGSGRSQFARAIHLAGDAACGTSIEQQLRAAMRRIESSGRPFVEFDCSSPNGHERPLFGCDADRTSVHGLDTVTDDSAVHAAFGGTLLLKHITELPGRLQSRLARILRDGEIVVQRQDGPEVLEPVTLRAIATMDPASSDERLVPLLRARLSETIISVPPLRKRRDDIPSLTRHLLADISASLHLPAKSASRQAVQLLCALPWKGNVHELAGLLRMLIVKVPGTVIRQGDVLRNIRLDGGAQTGFIYDGSLREARERFEREYVAFVLAQHDYRMAEAAKALGIQRTNLYRKVRQLSVKRRSADNRRIS